LQGLQPQLHWAAATGDIAPGLDDASALDGVRLLLLALTWAAPARGDAQPAPVQASAFAPVAATPDELGPAWLQAESPAAWAEPLSLRRPGRPGGAQADTLLAGAQAALPGAATGPGLGLGPALLALARQAAGLGLPAGSLVGAPALAAGAPWAAGDRIQLAARGLDGHSLVGSIDLQADAAEVVETPAVAEGAAPADPQAAA
jgi:fumarylacetoacetate (FAA) hydrolase